MCELPKNNSGEKKKTADKTWDCGVFIFRFARSVAHSLRFVCLFVAFENDWWNVSAAEAHSVNSAAVTVGNKLSFHIQFNHLWIYSFIVWLQEIIWYKYAMHNTHIDRFILVLCECSGTHNCYLFIYFFVALFESLNSVIQSYFQNSLDRL